MLVTLLWGCVHGPVPIPDAEAFEPPAVYRTWWREVETCSGLAADFDEVRWFTVPGYFLVLGGAPYEGFWFKTHRLVIPEGQRDDPMTVRHEMLHVILQREGHGAEFTERCRGLVAQAGPGGT